MKALKFEHITFGYKKGKPIFKDLSFEVRQSSNKGFVVGLMGISGSGKSSVLKLILGMEKDYEGRISMVPEKPVISYVPQEPVMFEHLTPLQNAEYFNLISNYRSKFNRELFNEVAKTLQIENVLKNSNSVNEISGGQRQRVSLLRAISIQPDILLLDEPLTGLDEEVKDQFLQTLAGLIQRFNLMVLYVTHHRKEAEFISDVILYLEKDKNSDTVSTVTTTDARTFFSIPPTVSSLNAIKEIRINTLVFRKLETGLIEPIEQPVDPGDANTSLISFTEDTIGFSKESGFAYEVLAKTGMFTLLKLKGTSTVLTMDNVSYQNLIPGEFISLSGQVTLYDSRGLFLRTTTITNNQIKR